jgi:hypothetical protein
LFILFIYILLVVFGWIPSDVDVGYGAGREVVSLQ